MCAPSAAISTPPLDPSSKASRLLVRVPFQPQIAEDPTVLTASPTPPSIILFQFHYHKDPQSLRKCARGGHSSVKRKTTALRRTPWTWMSTTILPSGSAWTVCIWFCTSRTSSRSLPLFSPWNTTLIRLLSESPLLAAFVSASNVLFVPPPWFLILPIYSFPPPLRFLPIES